LFKINLYIKNLKNLKPSRKSGFIQGYVPVNECKKYVGPGPIIYRSSWEKKFCLYCERTPEIVKWSSENLSIKYFSPIDNKYHNYFPDYLITLNTGEIFIVEIKPKSQLKKPNKPKRETPKTMKNYKWAFETWITNMCKKDAAEEFAKSRNWKYLLITEDFFKVKNK
jgi:hypothetical protein